MPKRTNPETSPVPPPYKIVKPNTMVQCRFDDGYMMVGLVMPPYKITKDHYAKRMNLDDYPIKTIDRHQEVKDIFWFSEENIRDIEELMSMGYPLEEHFSDT